MAGNSESCSAKLLTAASLTTVGNSLLTNYELGAIKLIPMKGHLALDEAQSARLGSAPVLFGVNRKSTALALLVMGAFEALVVHNSADKLSLKYRLKRIFS